MSWPREYLQMQGFLESHNWSPWHTAPEIAYFSGIPKTSLYRLLDRMIADKWIIWRWHPKRHGWHATRQYALPWLAKGK